MKKMITLFVLPVLFCLGGCNMPKKEHSSILSEEAVVMEVIYSPSQHGSGDGPTLSVTGKVGYAFTDVDIPEKYAIVFACTHGKFIIEGDKNHKAKKLWETLKENQKVRIDYREWYTATYRGDELLERRLVDYEFISATPIK